MLSIFTLVRRYQNARCPTKTCVSLAERLESTHLLMFESSSTVGCKPQVGLLHQVDLNAVSQTLGGQNELPAEKMRIRHSRASRSVLAAASNACKCKNLEI